MYLMSVYLGVFLTDVAQLTLFACLVYLLHLAYLVHLAGFPRGGGVLPIMAYMVRLRPKGVPFSGFRYIKG